MIFGLDYFATSSPVLRRYTYKILEVLVVRFKWKVRFQFDVSSAYLNAAPEIEQYLEQATGEIRPGDEDKVMLLKRAVPGTKDAGYWWYIAFSKALRQAGMTQTVYDQCLWFIREGSEVIFVGTIVDDGMVVGNSQRLWDKVRERLPKSYKLKEAPLTEFNGVRSEHDPIKMETKLDVSHYFEKAAQILSVTEPRARPAYPLITGGAWQLTQDDHIKKGDPRRAKLDKFPYAQGLNTIAYGVQVGAPWLLYPVSKLQQYTTSYNEKCITLLRRLAAYCLAHKDKHMVIKDATPEGSELLEAWSDCSFNADDTSASHMGRAISFCGNVIDASSNRIKEVCTSSAMAEGVGAASIADQVLGHRGALIELGEIIGITLVRGPTPIRQDNTSTITQMTTMVTTDKSRHYRRRVHRVMHLVRDGHIHPVYTPTGDHVADILTKVSIGYGELAERMRTASFANNPAVPMHATGRGKASPADPAGDGPPTTKQTEAARRQQEATMATEYREQQRLKRHAEWRIMMDMQETLRRKREQIWDIRQQIGDPSRETPAEREGRRTGGDGPHYEYPKGPTLQAAGGTTSRRRAPPITSTGEAAAATESTVELLMSSVRTAPTCPNTLPPWQGHAYTRPMSEAAQAWATHCMTYVHQLLSIEDPATTFLTTEWLVKAKHVFPFDAGLHTAMTPAMEEWLEQPEQQEARNLWGSPTVKVYVRPRLPRPPALPAQAPCPQSEGVESDELTRLRRDYPNIF